MRLLALLVAQSVVCEAFRRPSGLGLWKLVSRRLHGPGGRQAAHLPRGRGPLGALGVHGPSVHLASDLLSNPFSHSLNSRLTSPSIFDLGFGGPNFGDMDFGLLHRIRPSAEWQPLESVTHTVEITEENGERKRREYVTRCRDGKCTTEEVHADGTTSVLEAEGPAAVEQGPSPDAERKPSAGRAQATEAASFQRPAAWAGEGAQGPGVAAASSHGGSVDAGRAVDAADEVTTAAQDAEPWRSGEAGAEDAEVAQGEGEAAGAPGSSGVGVDAVDEATTAAKDYVAAPSAQEGSTEGSAPPRTVESVTRTIFIKEVDGRRETTEIVERCRDGKCTREVRRSGGEDAGEAIEG